MIDFTKKTHSIEFYFCIIFCNLGIVFNLLNIYVSSRKEIQKNTMGFYNSTMSVFNILSLVFTGYLIFFSQSIDKQMLILTSNQACMLILFFSKAFRFMSSWLNIMATFDRLIFVLYNYRNKLIFFKRTKNLTCIVVVLFAFILFLNIPNLFFHLEHNFNNSSNSTLTMLECTSSRQVVLLRDFVTIIMRIFLPLLLQIFMNSLLIHKLFKSKKDSNVTLSLKRENKFAFTIIVINSLYIVIELPLLGTIIVSDLFGYAYDWSFISTFSNESSFLSFVYVCSIVISHFVQVSLFFVNLITNKVFRDEVKSIFNILQQPDPIASQISISLEAHRSNNHPSTTNNKPDTSSINIRNIVLKNSIFSYILMLSRYFLLIRLWKSLWGDYRWKVCIERIGNDFGLNKNWIESLKKNFRINCTIKWPLTKNYFIWYWNEQS
jgi:hypothetical protein